MTTRSLTCASTSTIIGVLPFLLLCKSVSIICACRMMEGEYELRTAIPNKCYDDPAQTLRDAGLIPNAILMIRVKS